MHDPSSSHLPATSSTYRALFGAILRLRNILTSFDEFAGHELISPRDFQDFQSVYLNLYADWRGAKDTEKESINDDVVFEIELIKQVEVNVDYILTSSRRSATPSVIPTGRWTPS